MWWLWVALAIMLIAGVATAMTLLLRPKPTHAPTLAATLTPSPYTSGSLIWIDPKTGGVPNTPLVPLKGPSAAPGRMDARPGQMTDVTVYSPGYFQLYPTDVYTDVLVQPGFVAKLSGANSVEVTGSFDHQAVAPPGTGFTSMTVRQT